MAFDVKGKSVSDILNMDYDTFMGLTTSEMRQAVSRLVSAGNKRLRSFSRSGEKASPAYRKAMQSGGAFSTRGKDLNALRAEYKRAKQFFGSSTSTVAGWKKTKKEIAKGLKKKGVDLDSKDFDRFFQAYADLSEISPDAGLASLKYDVFKEISDQLKDKTKSPDEIAVELVDKVSSIYEEQQETELERLGGGVSDFFD